MCSEIFIELCKDLGCVWEAQLCVFSDVKRYLTKAWVQRDSQLEKKSHSSGKKKIISSSTTNVQVNALSITVTLLHQFSAAYKDRYDS